MVQKGRVRPETIVRGPTTRQFWMRADRTPGVSVLLGVCHACAAPVRADQAACASCNAELHVAPTDRQHLGLAPMADVPGSAPVRTEANTSEPERDLSIHKREAQRWRQRSKALGIVVVFLCVSLLSVGGVMLWRELGNKGYSFRTFGEDEANSTPAQTSTPSATTQQPVTNSTPSQTTPPGDPAPAIDTPDTSSDRAIDPALVGLDEELSEWHEDLRRAHELALSTSLADVERAVQLLERVLDEATRDLDDAEGRFPLLRARLAEAKATADRLFAEATLGG
jgi:hypothetical protein